MKAICKYCGKEFMTYPSRIKIGGGKYCSKECYYKGREYIKGEENPQYKREIRICKNCGEEYKVRPCEKKIFCSSECYGKWHKGINHKQYIKRIIKICPVCNKEFQSLPKLNQIYCSRKCSDISSLGRIPYNKDIRNGEYLICAICGKKYYASLGRIEFGSKYCSWECFSESKRRITGEEHPLYSLVEIKCDYCGKVYREKPAKIKMYEHHFCSRRCVGCYETSRRNNPSNIEKKLAGYLIDHNISFICQFKYKLGVADFFIKPNLIIEVDGDYWHNLPKVKERDERQTLFLEGEGYTVLHLWEYEINKEPEKCINRILEYV